MAKQPLSQTKKDELARGLQHKLRQGRPRTGLRLALATMLLSGVLVALYFASRPRPEPPPYLLVCPDVAQVLGQPVQVEARLSAAGAPDVPVTGEVILWRQIGGTELPPTPAPADGRARVQLPAQTAEGVVTLQVSYVEPRQTYRRDDIGRAFVWEKTRPLLLVPMAALVDSAPGVALAPDAPLAPDVLRRLIEEGTDRKLVYATPETDPVRYRQTRAWLQRQQAAGLPEGPLLIGDPATLEADLTRRFLAGQVKHWRKDMK